MIEAMKLPCRAASSQCYSPCRMHLLLILLLTSLVEPFRIDSSRYFPCTFRFNAARPRRTVLSQLSSTDQSKTEEELRKSLIASVTRPANGTGQNFDGTILTENYIDTDGDFFNVLKSRRPYYSIIVERMMQSIDDYQLSLKLKSSSLLQKQSISSKSVNSLVKEKIVVLGTGWGAHAFLKSIDATMYDVVVISPRNYFTFTPMLAASAVGTVEFRSICEPIRNVNPLANYLESAASSINFDEKVVSCVSVKCEGTACDMTTFDLSYDYLVLAVGATTNTFGIKGVREHCQFLKQIEDAIALRKAIANCFERANIPSLREEEIRAALSFVVVGAGPTGVEFTGELRDWLEVEGRRYYGGLLKYVRLTLVEAGSSVLAVFDESLQQEAIKKLSERETSLIADGYISEEITKIMLKSGVKEVGETYIEFMNGERLNYGFCVWAAGNGPIPLILDAVERVDAQKDIQSKARGRVAVDGWLRMLGTQGVFSIGDCSFISESPLPGVITLKCYRDRCNLLCS
jgi:NADH dehydrogenase FAD-containing subunit